MAATVGCDQISKAAARSLLTFGHPVYFLGGRLTFRLSYNVGAFLSLGARLPEWLRFTLFSVGGCLIILGGLYFLFKKQHLSTTSIISLSFVLGGALSNQIDRILFHGSVTDFLFLSLGSIHTGIFNLADMAIMFGVGFFFIESRRRPNPPLNPDPACIV